MATRAEIKSWIEGYDRNFDQLCQALMWRLCEQFGSVPVDGIDSAIDAYNIEKAAGRIQPGVGPAGSFVYWSIGKFGHVGFVLENGDIFMGTTNLQEEWGPSNRNAGIATNDFYVSKTGAKLLGWSWQNGGNTCPFTVTEPPAPQPQPSGNVVGPIVRQGADWAYRRPQGDLAKRICNALIARGRLPGNYQNDGDPREVFDEAVQVTLAHSGVFVGLIDGKIERGGSYGVQDYAIKFGDYRERGGVRDGRPEGLSWECFALGLERP